MTIITRYIVGLVAAPPSPYLVYLAPQGSGIAVLKICTNLVNTAVLS